MAAPFPYESVAGAIVDPAEAEALNLYRQYSWVARLVDEMDVETDLDLKRTMQLVFHSRQFRRWNDELQAHVQARLGKTVGEITAMFPSLDQSTIVQAVNYAVGRLDANAAATIADVVRGVFAAKKCVWATRAAMSTDLTAIYNTAGTAADWIEANASDYKQGYSINKEIAPGVMTDEPIKIAKPAGVATRLADFRALFSPKG